MTLITRVVPSLFIFVGLASSAAAQSKCGGEQAPAVVEIAKIDPCAAIHPARSGVVPAAPGGQLQEGPKTAYPVGYGYSVAGETRVGDHLYTLPSGHFGYDAFVVRDGPGGSTELDRALGENPFALIEHQNHQEHNSVPYYLLAGATRDSLGAYIGDGRTLHNPRDYHDGTWMVRGYPARVYQVGLAGEDGAQVTQNLHNVAKIIHGSVTYTGNYNRPIIYPTLNEQLDAYRSWLLGDEAAIGSNEMTAMIVNVALNLPTNEAAYEQMWPGEGKHMFAIATQKGLQETDFEPLWTKAGNTDPAKLEPSALAVAPIDAPTYVDARFNTIFTPSERLVLARDMARVYGMTVPTKLCDQAFERAWDRVVAAQAAELIHASAQHANPFRQGIGVAYPVSILAMLEDGTLPRNEHFTIQTIGTAVDESDLMGPEPKGTN